MPPDETKTSPNLLDRVRDWRDHPAWAEFFERYDPMLHRWCGRFALDGDAADELCQRIWVELMAPDADFPLRPQPRVPQVALAVVLVAGHRPAA